MCVRVDLPEFPVVGFAFFGGEGGGGGRGSDLRSKQEDLHRTAHGIAQVLSGDILMSHLVFN